MPDVYFNKNDKNNKNNKSEQQNAKQRRVDDTVYYSDEDFEDLYSDEQKPAVKPKAAPKKKKKKKKSPVLRILAGLLAVIILITAVGGVAGVSLLSKLSKGAEDKRVNEFTDASALISSATVKNILLLGVDSRSGDTYSRSDSMMLLSVNTVTQKITLTSFMRDMYVEIPGEYSTKINAACTYGGPELVADTIEYNFKIRIDNYILVNFEVFKLLVDAIGGIEVDVTEAEAEYMHGSFVNLPDIQAGENIKMNGNEALWYARIRKLDSDFNRTERQRKVIQAIVKKAVKTSPLKLYSAASDVLPEIVTDLHSSDILSLITMLPACILSGSDIIQQRIPADDTWSYGNRGGASVIVVDFEENINLLRTSLYGE